MHTIRLTGSWEWEPGGETRCVRRFHWLARLSDGEHVGLVIQPSEGMGQAAVFLNGVRLGVTRCPDPPARFDITPYLEPTNQVVIEFAPASRRPADPTSPVRIAELVVESGGL